MLLSCCKAEDQGKFERLFALEPGASTLVVMVHFLAAAYPERLCGRGRAKPSRIV